MPFTKTPIAQTYDTKRINFISNPQQRSWDSSKDLNLVNFMVENIPSELGEKRQYIKTRPGLKEIYPALTSSEIPCGHYYWRYTQTSAALIRFVSTTSYGTRGNVDVYNGNMLIGSIGMDPYIDGKGDYKFTEFLTSTGEAMLVAVNGWRAFTIRPTATLGIFTIKEIQPFAQALTTYALDDVVTGSMAPGSAPPSGVAYKCTTAGTTGAVMPVWPTTIGATVTDGTVVWECIASSFPRPHLPSPVFLDGYLFLIRAKTNYTGSFALPTNYTATNDIYNSDLDDPASWLDGNYTSAEMYADVLVALSKNNNFVYGVGTDSVEYFFDSGNPTGSPLTRNPSAIQQFGSLEPDSIVQTEDEVIMVGNTHDGSPTVWTINGFEAKEIGTPAVKLKLAHTRAFPGSITASVVRVSGQKLYVLNVPGLIQDPNPAIPNSTLVYSFTTKMWSEWKIALDYFHGVNGVDGPNGPIFAFFSGTYGGGSSGGLCEMNEDYTDDDVFGPLVAEAITAKLDFDSIKRKFGSKLSIIGDFPSSSVIYVDWSDDDYTTWSTARAVVVSNELPAIFQLGSFRRRAFRLATSDKVRIDFMELDINKGIT